jgi:hypothetical protein
LEPSPSVVLTDDSLVVGGGVAIVIAVVVGVVLVGVVLFVAVAAVSRAARKAAEAARAQYPNARHVEAGALFFGQESRGVTQMRGNGTLVFTNDEAGSRARPGEAVRPQVVAPGRSR